MIAHPVAVRTQSHIRTLPSQRAQLFGAVPAHVGQPRFVKLLKRSPISIPRPFVRGLLLKSRLPYAMPTPVREPPSPLPPAHPLALG